MNTELTNYQPAVKEIGELFTAGVNSWRKAGELLVALYDAAPTNRAKILQDLKHLPVGVLATLEKIGRKRMVAEVSINSGPGWQALRRMPYDVQERLVSAPVEMVVMVGERADILNVHVEDMSRDQAALVFGSGVVRTPSAQRAYLADAKSRAIPPERIDVAYTVGRDSLTIARPCELTRKQLAAILAQMG